MLNPKRPFETTVAIYIIIIALLFILKPDFIFNNPNFYYKFGLPQKNLKKRKTIMPLWLLFLILGIVIYYFVVAYSVSEQ